MHYDVFFARNHVMMAAFKGRVYRVDPYQRKKSTLVHNLEILDCQSALEIALEDGESIEARYEAVQFL